LVEPQVQYGVEKALCVLRRRRTSMPARLTVAKFVGGCFQVAVEDRLSSDE
jgi:hypothetical protein